MTGQVLEATRAPKGQAAYVTLLANGDYLPGAAALARSLRLSGTEADLVIMHTGALARADLAALDEFDARLVHAPLLDVSEDFAERHARGRLHADAPFTKGRKPEFHSPLANFCKLRLWQLSEYDRLVFLDADTIVLRNIDVLFGYPELCAAPNVYESLADFHRMNSGVFTARPSAETFAAMLAHLDRPGVFWRRTDQTFLQDFFPAWHGLPVFFNMLQYVWFNLPALWDWNSVKVVHYQYEKPWEADHPKAEKLATLIELWRAYHDGKAIPDVAALPKPPGAE